MPSGKEDSQSLAGKTGDELNERVGEILEEFAGATKHSQKETSSQEELIRKQTKLAEDQDKELQNARKQAHNANAIPGAVPSTTSSSFSQGNTTTGMSPDEAEQRRQELEEEKRNLKEELTQEMNQSIEEAEQDRDEKIEKLKQGPQGLLKLFAGPTIFFLIAGIDLLVNSIPYVGGTVGNVVVFVAALIIWAIPALLLFDLFLYLKIVAFYIFDLFFGGISTVTGLVPGLGGLVDTIPEAGAWMFKFSPPHLIRKAYDDKLPSMIAKEREQCKNKINRIKAGEKEKWRLGLKKLQGHFTGVALEGRKVLSTLFIFLVLALSLPMSPFGGILGFESKQQIIFTVVFVIFLYILKAIQFLGTPDFVKLVGFLALILSFRYIVVADTFLSRAIGSTSSWMITVLFVVAAVLYILHMSNPDKMTLPRMMAFLLFVALILVSPRIIGYVGSDQFQLDIQSQQVQAQADIENLNFWERAIRWYTEMHAKGSGEYIPVAQQEQVHEFIGLTLDGVEATRDEFLEGTPVQFNVYYSTGSKESLQVLTTCSTEGIQGAIEPSKPILATNLYAPAVKCTFSQGLPKGTHLVTFQSFYDYSSQIQIPVMFMSDRKYNEILEGQGDPATFEGGVNKPLTSSGPVDFGVSNAKEGQLKMPLVINPENPNEFPQLINIRLDNPPGDARTQGDLKSIQKVVFDLPEGIQVGNCNFQDTTGEVLAITSKLDGRWVVDMTSYFNTVDPYKTVSCNLYFADNYVDKYIPVGTDFSIQTLYYDIKYTYVLEEKVPVTIT
ncbi:MAG: hypothetical protein KC535_00675 [Nanoarchaeota archaeon]|nr:hypothetical protein [Nanoarchaeota archaeon]